MSYTSDIEAELQRLHGHGGQLVVADGAGSLHVDLTGIDRLGCEFTDFAYETSALASLNTADLKKLGNRVAAALHYLTEPIQVIEIDGHAGVAQLRSTAPVMVPSGARYYEVLVKRGGSLSIRRYEAAAGQSRQSIPAIVTREVFHRLADDFSKMANSP